jgi:segregation and condensation protein A
MIVLADRTDLESARSGGASSVAMRRPPAEPTEDPGDATSFVVELTHFSGPLDLLLTLLREEQIDIFDIPIARIAEQFLDRIQSLRLDDAAEYLEMAARLLRIKAQMLLPRHDGEESWDDPRAELVRRLLEYQQVREVVDVLDSRAELRRNRFAHPPAPAPVQPSAPARLSVALVDLLAAVDRVLRLARGPSVHAVVPRALDVAGAVDAARALLARRDRLRWIDLVPAGAEAWQVLSVLLALLELARLGECLLRQPVAFGPVEIDAAEPPAATLTTIADDVAIPAADVLVAAIPDSAPGGVLVSHIDAPHDSAGAAA